MDALVKCQALNPNDLATGSCGKPATWIVQAQWLGYPSNNLVADSAEPYCDAHAALAVTRAIADNTLTVAGFQMARVAHWNKHEEVRSLRG